jgi:hypothetical protein
MKLLSVTTLTLCGLLCLGVSCSEAEKGMAPDPNAKEAAPTETGETNPIVDQTAGKETPPSHTAGEKPAAETPTWIVYTLPG